MTMLLPRSATAFLSLAMLAAPSFAEPSKVVLIGQDGNWQLTVDGQPFFIQGAGGDASKQMLKDIGGNSFRTWGVGGDTQAKLDEAQKLGLKVTLGIWLGHEEHGFKYTDAAQVAKQLADAKAAVLKFKDHPALLMWCLGNEMEGYKNGDNVAMWKALQDLAAMVRKTDPNHPTMTVIAEIGGKRVECINQYCPDIDVVGINSYGGGPSIAQRYRAAGGVKPFVITEFGPPGTWEVGKNSWKVALELTSTAKAERYRETWEKAIAAEKGKLSLGGYAFTWGAKQEATATWYGMFLHDGTRLEAMDTMRELWTGKPAPNRCPQLRSIKPDGADKVAPGGTVRVALDVMDPENDAMTVKWKLDKDMSQYEALGGETQAAPPTYPDAIIKGDLKGAEVKMPQDGGGYVLYASVYDGKGGAAVANVPLLVTGDKTSGASKPKAAPAKLPLTLYADNMDGLPYVWSGWMGKTDAIAMDEKSADNPHSGDSCMKCEFKSADNFGGIIWQSPANDWGKAPGGKDLTGATKLSFWARGVKGDEKVKFVLGIIQKDQPFPDSDGRETEVKLTTEWKKYEIDLTNLDLSCIKTGFGWIVGGQGAPVTFYLDDIQFEGKNGAAPATPPAAAAAMPFDVYKDGLQQLPYIWSGWMGKVDAIGMDEKFADNPHSGTVCMKCEFKSADNFGGIVWQNPANDWGKSPGGKNLTAAKKLTLWARGAKGGEKVKFLFGVIKKDQPFFDTASGETEVTLTPEWKQYEIDLAGKDLKRIKTGFGWVVGGQGAPVTFYLDDIRYE